MKLFQVDIFVDGKVLHNLDIEMEYSDNWNKLPQFKDAVTKYGNDRVSVTIRDKEGNQI